MKIPQFLYILLTLFVSLNCFSQFSKTHYIPPLSNSDSQEPQGQYIYISTPSTTAVDFVIQEIGGNSISGTVSRDNPYIYNIGIGYDTQLLISKSDVNTVKNNKGFIINAQDLIYANVRLTSTQLNYQAGGLVSKGKAALGTHFRIGAFVNTGVTATSTNHYTFATILATENNTTISFGDIKPGVQLVNNIGAGSNPSNIILNAGESFAMAVVGPTDANRDGLIGASITSDKPIAVNCGSFAGSNGTSSNLDLGMDQIVSAERTGTEYIFVKGSGVDVTERPLLIADLDNTEIFLNGSTTPVATLNSGEYLALSGADFSVNGNLYVSSSKNIFAYQGIGGSDSQANQNMHFVPPLSCQTPKSINNIPKINEVGNLIDFIGTVCIVTKTGADLTFIINGINYTTATLPNNYNLNGPLSVIGNPNFVTYTMDSLTGNVSVFSTEQVYVSYYGSSGAATYGGFYSGFTFKPEIVFQPVVGTTSNCIPNINLNVNSISNFDIYQWYYNGTPISGANSNTYTPLQPGYYKIKASLTECGIDYFSDEIPVSSCPLDTDNDSVIDNLDVDNDNDGITNCTESNGDQVISLLNPALGTITASNYSNSFTGIITTSASASAVPFVGSIDGSFVTEVPAGRTNQVKYEMTFDQPISLDLQYISTANTTDLLDSNGSFIINSPINKTITVLNPTNQLLIDTNYDGIYESGITQYSSFEIHFRLNSIVPLAAGTGTFKFVTNYTNTLQFTHSNLSDSVGNKATFKLKATCVSNDTDSDGIPNEFDFDSENDGIPDAIEAQGANTITLSGTDVNNDGLDDAFGSGISAADSDNDGVQDYLDLDSDNDGVFDLFESGSGALDSNLNGIIDGNNFGLNGLANSLETTTDNGIINYTVTNTDSDLLYNYLDLESDGDGCLDVNEAGYSQFNSTTGTLGNSATVIVNSTNGLVTNGPNYINPNQDYGIGAPIQINTQPQNVITCETQGATFTIDTNAVTSYQWLEFNGITWSNVTNNAIYSGATTNTLTISNVSAAMIGYKYKVILSKNGNSCGLESAEALLTNYPSPVLTSPILVKQCDDDTDGISIFNLTLNNPQISSNFATDIFSYFTSQIGANTNDPSDKIMNPIAYTSGTGTVWVRVQNTYGCISIGQIDLLVSATQINAASFHRYFTLCDDSILGISTDTDGTSVFDFSSVTNDINLILPPPSSNYTIKYYANNADALSQINAINPASYRNTILNQQQIFVRIDSNNFQGCFGLGPFITLTAEALPVATPVNSTNTIRHCDDDQDGIYTFDTSQLEASILNGQTNKTVTFYDASGTVINPIPAFTVNTIQTITVRVTNNSTQASNGPCYDEATITFIVDKLPQIYPVSASQLIKCDDEINNPAMQNGIFPFDTSTIESTLIGSQTGMTISFTLANGQVLPHLPNPFNSVTQNVIATIINPLNTSCPAISTLNFVVNPIPKIDLNTNGEANEIVCTNLPSFSVTINAGVYSGTPTSIYSYQWYLNNVLIPGATNYSLNVSQSGNYAVVVTTAAGCSEIRPITVTSSVIATIDQINIVDLSDNNTVNILVSGNGNYEYSITDSYGPYQTSNYFQNVNMGFHTVYVKDLNGCGIAEKSISVLGAPKYFSPNGDGFNDTWNIKGANYKFYFNTLIKIFDRYGKFIKQISPVGEGWDGTLNGYQVPSDDYWYNIQLEDGRNAKGHFSLIR